MSYHLHEDATLYWVVQYEAQVERLEELTDIELHELSNGLYDLRYYPQALGVHERILRMNDAVFHEQERRRLAS
jgi:hypothetical protein